MSTPIMSDLFRKKSNPCYSLSKNDNFHIASVNAIFVGLGNISFLKPKTWTLVPSDLKSMDYLENLKKSIIKWKAENCQYQNIAFL